MESGLSSETAKKKLDQVGFNEIKETKKNSWIKILLRQVRSNFMVYLLIFAAIISFFVGEDITSYTILVVILMVVIVGFFQEYKAEKAVQALKKMIMQVSIVIRDGKEQEIPSKEIVPGDIILLRTGEKVPADCVILGEKGLLINEAVLTGESNEIKKQAAKNKNYKDENLIFMGSFVVSGKCTAKVLQTGMKTKFGNIASLISLAEKDLPLQKKVNKITRFMAILGITMAILTGLAFLFSSEITTKTIIETLILVIAISVSVFPEGLPVVLITSLSVGVHRMAQRNAIVNRMSIIETLGETTVICTDKTGTITKGEMTVKEIFTDLKKIEVTGTGYTGKGNFLKNKTKLNLLNEKTLGILLRTGILCNDARIERKDSEEENQYKVFGTPTEAALLVMATKAGIQKENLGCVRIEEIPFTSEKKMMSVLCKDKKEMTVYSKGALEFLLKNCQYIQRDSGVFRLLEKDKQRILAASKEMSSRALRTLALAYKKTTSKNKDEFEKDLVFLGLVGIEDAPREEVKDAILTCKNAGISVKMITGDDMETALSIANQIGLNKGKVLEGEELDKMSDKELFKVVREVVVFARVKPEHKLRIVRSLKEHGEIVTMTGDGVNDSPALKEAHIGVAMGKNGTDVSRSVADLTLKDDNFATIVDAIKEGRTIFHNIQKFVSYQLSCNFAELTILFLAVLLSPLLGWPIPILLALHILFMNLVTDNLPAVTLGFSSSSQDIMGAKPRINAQILTKNLIKVILFAGIFMALITLGVFYFTFNFLHQTVSDARTTTLLALIIVEIANAFNFRSFRKLTLSRSPFINKYLVFASLISILATIAIIYTPLNIVFETVPLHLFDWLVAGGFAILLILVFDLLKRLNNGRKFCPLD